MIPITFPGFGNMTVRNTNMGAMSSFVVMIRVHFPRKTIRKKEQHDHLCNYENNSAIG